MIHYFNSFSNYWINSYCSHTLLRNMYKTMFVDELITSMRWLYGVVVISPMYTHDGKASWKHSLIPRVRDFIKRSLLTVMLICHAMEERLKITMLDMILQLPNMNKIINVLLKEIIRVTKATKQMFWFAELSSGLITYVEWYIFQFDWNNHKSSANV